MGRYASGQIRRTVNPLAQPSGVRIPPCPLCTLVKYVPVKSLINVARKVDACDGLAGSFSMKGGKGCKL